MTPSLRRGLVLGLAVAASLGLFLPSAARADAHGGALTAHLLLGNTKSPELGGALLADLWFVDGALRVGGAAGLGFLGGDDASRVLAPIGASVAVSARPEPVGFSLRLRAGGWAGAMDQGFAGGGWLAAAFHIEYAFDPRVALTAGMDAWFLFGHGDATAFAPGISLVFLPGES